MKLLDMTFPTPAGNLACDEALLDLCESGHEHEILRFWEPPAYFVVVGYANSISTEVNVAACRAGAVPILRRCTGGGTVLQGPGCLNYSLILRITDSGPLQTITSANRFTMERNREAIQSSVLSPQSSVLSPQAKIEVCGHTDLALVTGEPPIVVSKKFSGNAQRRRRRFLLFHGTFLLDFELERITEVLPMPSKQPGYRENRAHHEFLQNLPLKAAEVKAALRQVWDANEPLETVPLETIRLLARDKYEKDDWNLRL